MYEFENSYDVKFNIKNLFWNLAQFLPNDVLRSLKFKHYFWENNVTDLNLITKFYDRNELISWLIWVTKTSGF